MAQSPRSVRRKACNHEMTVSAQDSACFAEQGVWRRHELERVRQEDRIDGIAGDGEPARLGIQIRAFVAAPIQQTLVLGPRLRKEQTRRAPTAYLNQMLAEYGIQRTRNDLLLIVQEPLPKGRFEPCGRSLGLELH